MIEMALHRSIASDTRSLDTRYLTLHDQVIVLRYVCWVMVWIILWERFGMLLYSLLCTAELMLKDLSLFYTTYFIPV